MNIDGNALYRFGDGAVIAIIAIIMVFAILLLIIGLTDLITKLVSKNEVKENLETENQATKLDLNDEDAVVACLVASIDYRRQTGKQIEVLSVREVK